LNLFQKKARLQMNLYGRSISVAASVCK
jgi:hypothetical protein